MVTYRAKRHILASIGLWVAILLVSLWWNVAQIQDGQLETHLENARSLFSLIVTTREWNAAQGGVYLPVTDSIQPNPYLTDPRRDITTTDGQQLTKINPAYMTRLIAEVAQKKDAVKFHITSLKPIRPANKATDWETAALQAFESEQKTEVYGYENGEQGMFFRYMAPLLIDQSCLKCHAAQGYQLGDVRGGISVSFPVWPASLWAIILTHLALALGGSGALWIYGKKLDDTLEILENHSHIDGLTQVHNRRYFDEALTKEFSRCKRNKTTLSFALCDIDDFKAYNDTYGHVAGDECLKKVAQALKVVLKRPGDVLARYGGEEFGVILPYTPADGALTMGNLLRAKIESLHIPHKGSKVSEFVTVSIGVATYCGDETNRNDLLRMADEALYQAKAGGKNFVMALNPRKDETDPGAG